MLPVAVLLGAVMGAACYLVAWWKTVADLWRK